MSIMGALNSNNYTVMPLMTEQRFRIASLIAPCIPVLFIFFVLVDFETPSFQWNFLFVGFALFIGYLGFFMVGFPLIYILRRNGFLSLPMLMLSGLVLGVLVFYLFWLLLGFLLGSSVPYELSAILWGAALGLCVALSFGLIAGITWRSSGRKIP